MGELLSPILDIGSKLIDRMFPDPQKAQEAKLQLLQMQQSGELAAIAEQTKVVVAEAQGGSWLQRNWRPLTMMVFVSLVVAKWLGFTAPGITEQMELQLMELIKLGLGGYVIGRSAEKIAGTVAQVWKDKS
jgi:hypothetical protein